jgi:hypothetical protein
MTRGTFVAHLAVLVLGALVACGGSTAGGIDNGADAGANTGAGSDGGSTSGGGGNTAEKDAGRDDASKTVAHAPVIHRATAVACSHVRGPGDAQPSMGAMCQADGDCTTGTNGRCLATKVAVRTNYCSYDTCFEDADCGGKVCTCREFASDANRCQDGNCKVDADCGAGGYCSPSVDPDKTNFGFTGWWCHTKSDECIDDTDCIGKDKKQNGKCAYDPKTSHWSCSDVQFLPP